MSWKGVIRSKAHTEAYMDLNSFGQATSHAYQFIARSAAANFEGDLLIVDQM